MLTFIKKHYHWLIAVIVFLEMIVYGGLINSASIFIQPISTDLNVPTTAYSVAVMPYTVVCFIGTSLSGVFFARFGYKKTALVSILLITASLALTAVSNNILVFGISKVLFGMGYGACFTAGAVYIIKGWFWKHQGLVLGAVNMATGLGGSLMTVILSGLIDGPGWRTANWVAAAMMGVVGVLFLLIKDRPEHLKLRPYGYGAPLQNKKKARQGDHDWPGAPMKEQLRRPVFYLMCLAVVASCVCLYTTSGFVVPYFKSIGLTSEKAASYQAIYMLTLAVAKLVIGFLYDRFGAKPVMIACMLCGAAGQALMGWFSDPIMTFIGIELFAVGLCMSSIMIPLVAAPLFGYQGCMAVNGILLGLSSFSSLFSSPISSMCYDATGKYAPVYRVTGIVLLGVLFVYLLLFAMVKKEKQRCSAAQ